MQYAISDLHGCYNTYLQMLRKIRFCEDDTLYLIGDAIDRGNDGIKILLDVLTRPNVHLLMGNHEYIMALLLSKMADSDRSPKQLKADFQLWLDDGGKPTLRQFLALSEVDQRRVTVLLAQLPLYAEITVGGREYILVHSGFDSFSPDRALKRYSADELLFHRHDFKMSYFPSKTVIVVHTPMFAYGPEFAGRMIHRNGISNIDCGCFYDKGGGLGCLRLDDMIECYVENTR